MEKDKNSDLFFVAVLAIGAIAAYSIIENTVWTACEVFLSKKAYEAISYYIIDTVVCIACLLFYIPFVYFLKKRDNVAIFDFQRKNMNPAVIVFASYVITCGISGITTKWLDFVYEFLEDVPFFKDSIESYDTSWGGIDEEPYFFVFMSVILLGPVVEELMFRGVLFNLIYKKAGHVAAILLSSLIFGIWHMELVQSIYTTLFGIALSVIYLYTRSIIFPIFCHCLYNFLGTLPPALETEDIVNVLDNINFISMLPALVLIVLLWIDQKNKNCEAVTETNILKEIEQ